MKPTATTGELRHLLHIIEFPLGFTSIGSGAECDVSLADPRIEPLHACIVAGLSGVVLCDLSSAGILVNGSRIRGATLLRDGERLQMGGERFVVATAREASTTSVAFSTRWASIPANTRHRTPGDGLTSTRA